MWLTLNRFEIATGELTEVTSLSPATFGIMVEIPVIEEAIRKDLNAESIKLVVITAVHPYFTQRPVPENLIACFGASEVNGVRSEHDWAYVITFE
ncbi:hypothetical protein D3C75_224310 [compost metagenome]